MFSPLKAYFFLCGQEHLAVPDPRSRVVFAMGQYAESMLLAKGPDLGPELQVFVSALLSVLDAHSLSVQARVAKIIAL
jgi:hypothetical protein